MQRFIDIGPPVKEAIGYTQTYANIIIMRFLMINKAQRLLLRNKLTDKQKHENFLSFSSSTSETEPTNTVYLQKLVPQQPGLHNGLFKSLASGGVAVAPNTTAFDNQA